MQRLQHQQKTYDEWRAIFQHPSRTLEFLIDQRIVKRTIVGILEVIQQGEFVLRPVHVHVTPTEE